MEKSEITYRLADIQNSPEDIDIILNLQQKLSDYLKCDTDVWFDAEELREDLIFRAVEAKNSPAYFYLAEYNGKPIGYIEVMYYCGKAGFKTSEIRTIFVENQYRNGHIAYNLLKLGLKKLQEVGKNNAILNVQEDNPNRFLHFAITDNCKHIEYVDRKDGRKVKSFELYISDINRILSMTEREIAIKTVKLKRQQFNPLQYNTQKEEEHTL